jgi:malate/lactate dehydrogenase
MKACPLVDELALYDVVNTPGVAADLSHISSIAVRSFRYSARALLIVDRKLPATFLKMMA